MYIIKISDKEMYQEIYRHIIDELSLLKWKLKEMKEYVDYYGVSQNCPEYQEFIDLRDEVIKYSKALQEIKKANKKS
jgi:hypothetical protein